MIIDVSMGEVKLKPLKKTNWLQEAPKSPQITSLKKSFFATFSLTNNLIDQNKMLAPKTRKKTKGVGFIFSGMMPFAIK
jgi:hypothetical protein